MKANLDISRFDISYFFAFFTFKKCRYLLHHVNHFTIYVKLWQVTCPKMVILISMTLYLIIRLKVIQNSILIQS